MVPIPLIAVDYWWEVVSAFKITFVKIAHGFHCVKNFWTRLLSDIKFWLHFLEKPVIVVVNADGGLLVLWLVSGGKCAGRCCQLIRRGNASDSSCVTLVAVTRQYRFKHYHVAQFTALTRNGVFDD